MNDESVQHPADRSVESVEKVPVANDSNLNTICATIFQIPTFA